MRLLLFLLVLCPLLSGAQTSSKLNIDLHRLLEKTSANDYAQTFVPVLIKGNLAKIQTILQQEEGNRYKYGVRNIASANASLQSIRQLLEHPQIKRIEYRRVPALQLTHPEDTAMFNNNNVWDAHTGGAALPHGFEGQGVLLAMIDDGIEWKHPDFLNADSSMRIQFIWDQTSTDANYYESYFGYGASWDSSALNVYQCTHNAGDHGSHVMGIAGGNAQASGKFMGIAPKADIACVKIKNNDFLTSFVDGVHYLFRMADSTQQPCVINSSVGSYSSGHDSKDLATQLIDNMLTAKAGRALVQAAGNAREDQFHLGVQLNNSTSKTWFRYHNTPSATHFSIYADTADFNTVDFSLQLIDPNNHQQKAQTTIYNILEDFSFTGAVAQKQEVLFYDSNNLPVILNIYIDQYADAYEIYINIFSSTDLGYWQLTTNGTGSFDIWSKTDLTGTSNIVKEAPIPNYQAPDSIQSIVGFWTTSDKVITVGSYQNRSAHIDYTGDTVGLSTAGFPKYQISHFSSLGPSRTGGMKPDITAPGGQVLSAASLSTINYYKQTNNNRLNEDGWHITNRGTSMSAPMVAGAVALYLQCQPQADYAQIKTALQSTARQDGYVFSQTVAFPNIHWGYGKLDVYELVKSCAVYGCTDSAAVNYNAMASFSDSSCAYVITNTPAVFKDAFLQCSPNPSHQATTINYSLPRGATNTDLVIYNTLGQVIDHQSLQQVSGQYQWRCPHSNSAVFWVVLRGNGQIIRSKKLIFID